MWIPLCNFSFFHKHRQQPPQQQPKKNYQQQSEIPQQHHQQPQQFINGAQPTAALLSTPPAKKQPYEELDTKRFTLGDLVGWRPKTENDFRRKLEQRRQQLLECTSAGSSSGDAPPSLSPPSKKSSSTIGPRVKINEHGEMVIDEESLTVLAENPENNALWETVHDGLLPKRLNSMSFRRNRRRVVAWSATETDLFYGKTNDRIE